MDDPASLFPLLFAETGSAAEVTILAISINILAVIVLVFINGFFVAAEFAYVSVRKSRIEMLAEEGVKSAKRLMIILDNLSAYLSASQLGITIASLALGWIGEPAVAAILAKPLASLPVAAQHTIAFVIAFSIISSLHIVLGEQAPKLFGLEMAEKVAMMTALPMQIFYRVFKLPIHALDWTSAKVVKLFGINAGSEHASIYTEDEIRGLIKISKESGHLNEEEQKLINQVFEFSETTVREAMIPRPEIIAIPVTSTLEEIAETFREHGFSRLPIYRESLDDIAGVIHSKDVMINLIKPESFRIDKLLRRPVYVVDTARLEDVLRKMQKEKFHFGFVVDEHGGVEGIITLEDLLEEIVGDIADEYDEEATEQIHEQKDGSFVLDGGLAVRDLNRRLGVKVPVSESYTTIAGFLMSEAGQVLKEGEQVRFNGHIFEIEEVEKHRILKVKMVEA
ncbi:MAG: HlyC/CorC family transporter [Acidobacteria bacterium]|nr:HlyC/CorC family transporter [Acidobacteriota bacterium]